MAPFTSLRQKFLAASLLTSVVALAIAGAGLFLYDLKGYRESSANSLAADAQLLGNTSSAALQFDDPETARQNLSYLSSRPTVRAAAIYGPSGKPFATYTRADIAPDEIPAATRADETLIGRAQVAIFRQITQRGEHIGSVYLAEDLAIGERMWSYALIALAVMLAALAISAGFAAWLQRSFTRPVIEVSNLARRIVGTKDYSLRAKITTRDETAALVEAFNEMLEEIQRRTAALEISREEVMRLNTELERRVRERTAQLEESNLQLRDANAAKSNFLSMMSHEIRTPMNGVLGMLELLSLGELDPSQRSTLAIVRESGRALLRIIDDILDFSKIEAGKLEIRDEVASIPGIVASVVGIYSGNASSKGLFLRSRVDPRLVPVTVDPLRLQQILNNLVSNAIKFTEKGSVELEAQLLERRAGEDVVRFSVSDTGVGVSPEQKARLFQPFAQAEGVTRVFGGTGLGLSIGQRLAGLMGGRLEIDSELGKGTTVALTLAMPLAPAEAAGPAEGAAGAAVRKPVAIEGRRKAPTPEEAEREGTLVLVVDDHPINRMLLMRQVSVLGYGAVTAEDGREALAAWRARRFGLIITDCNMPEMDGYELAHAIRSEERARGLAHTLIIACTANALKGEADKCFAAGMDDYIAKPVELPTLLAKLEQWLPIPDGRRGAPDAGASTASYGGADDVLDTRALNELTGGDPEFRRQVLVEFARAFPGDLERMREAFEARDMDSVAKMAHRLKGVSASVGAMRVAQACTELEAAGRDSRWDAIVSSMRTFEEQAERLRVEIARLTAVDRDAVR